MTVTLLADPRIWLAVGLCLNVLGGLLMWRHGIPTVATREGGAIVSTPTVEYTEVVRRHDRWAGRGAVLFLLGFGFQLVGVLLS